MNLPPDAPTSRAAPPSAPAAGDRKPLPCIAIAGPTAAGKTDAALALAAVLDRQGQRCEIISVDSALVYRGMDIGTAKPSVEERAAVPHHLIDIRDPLQAYSAAEFVRDTNALIADIHARGALPLLVGGTMLYYKAWLDGMDDMPAAHPEVRAALDARAAERGWPALHAELAQVDPATAARLSPNDSQRIQRALEVWEVTGKPLSHFHVRSQSGERERPLAAGAFFSLETEDRPWLHARIARRFEHMLDAGFLDEVRALRQRPELHVDLPSIRCVGYRQAWEALDEAERLGRPLDRRQLAERGIVATRQLAKRQITWLRGMDYRTAIACEQPTAAAQLVACALHSLDRQLGKDAKA